MSSDSSAASNPAIASTSSASSTSTFNKSRGNIRGTGRTRFLRGVLDGWKSVASSSISSLDSPVTSSVACTSHSSSCGHLVTGVHSYDDSYVPTSDDLFTSKYAPNSTLSDELNRSGKNSGRSTPLSYNYEPLNVSSNTSAPVSGHKVDLIFKNQVTCLAYDPIQKVIALGYSSGHLRLLPLTYNQRTDANGCRYNQYTCNSLPGNSNQLIDCYSKHPSGQNIKQIIFVINDGTLITRCDDGCLYHWSWKSSITKSSLELITSSKLPRSAKATYIYLPFGCKWLYIGTDRGNILFCPLDKLSTTSTSYMIGWNRCIDSTTWNKIHPGCINFIIDSPTDPSKLYFTFDSYNQLICWDFKNKSVDQRIILHEAITSLSWHHEGKQFMCSHTDGSLTTWQIKVNKPVATMYPHARQYYQSTGHHAIEPCHLISRMELKTSKSTEPYVIFAGGLPINLSNVSGCEINNQQEQQLCPLKSINTCSSVSSSSCTSPSSSSFNAVTSSSSGTSTPTTASNATISASSSSSNNVNNSLSIIHGESTQVIQLKSAIVDFITLCESPHNCDFNEPFAVAVLLSNDLILLDLSRRNEESSATGYDGGASSISTPATSVVTGSSSTGGIDNAKYSIVNLISDEIELLSSHSATSTLFNSTREIPKLSLINRFLINTNITSSSTTYDDIAELLICSSTSSSSSNLKSSSVASGTGASSSSSSSSLLDTSRLTAGSLAAEVMKAKAGFIERGEKLEQLEDRTARMANEAEGFQNLSHQLLNKYKDKKWYQF